MKVPSYLALAVCFLLTGCITTSEKKVGNGSIEMDNVENLQLSSVDGETPQGVNVISGKPIVVNLWATWCKPCVAELPDLTEAERELREDIDFYFVSDESPEKIKKFVEKNNYDQSRFLKLNQGFEDLKVNGVPVTFFYNKSGQLVEKNEESMTKEAILQRARKLL